MNAEKGLRSLSRIKKEREDKLMNVLDEISQPHKTKSQCSTPVHKESKKGSLRLENAGKLILSSENQLIETLSNLPKRNEELLKGISKTTKRDDSLETIKSKHSSLLRSSKLKKSQKHQSIYKNDLNKKLVKDDEIMSIASHVSRASKTDEMKQSGRSEISNLSTKDKIKELECQIKEERTARMDIENEVKGLKNFLAELASTIKENEDDAPVDISPSKTKDEALIDKYFENDIDK